MAHACAGRVFCIRVFPKGFGRPHQRARVKEARPLFVVSGSEVWRQRVNSEHTIVQGANRIDSCAEYLKQQMAEEGYKTSVTKVAGGIVTQVHVVKLGSNNRVVAYAILSLWNVGEDLKFKIENNSAVDSSVDVSLSPLDILVPLGPIVKLAAGMAKSTEAQKILEDKVFLTVSKFMTES